VRVRPPPSAPINQGLTRKTVSRLATGADSRQRSVSKKATRGAPAAVDLWIEADTVEALALRRPLPDDALRIVAKGEKEDRNPEVTL
jgi:hypothetical protein